MYDSAVWSLPLLLMIVLAGCGEEEAKEAATTGEERAREGFGSPYEIVTSPSLDAPEEWPHVAGDSLVAPIAYPGGCENHRFSLGHRTRRGTTRLWIHHRAGGETCSTRVSDQVRLALPQEAVGADNLLLLNPQADEPFVLRSGTPRFSNGTSSPSPNDTAAADTVSVSE